MDDLGVPPWIGNLQMMVVLRKIMPPTVYFRLVIWISIVPHPRIVPVRTVAICGSVGNSLELKCGVSWECTPAADHLEMIRQIVWTRMEEAISHRWLAIDNKNTRQMR